MPYLKHPALGNQHASDEEACDLEAKGWTRFPRSAGDKAAGPWPPVKALEVAPAPIPDAPIKRKPGRPKKSA